MRKASQLLWSFGNNLNQYVKKENATGSIYLEDINSIKEMQRKLIQVYGEVLSELMKILEAVEKAYL